MTATASEVLARAETQRLAMGHENHGFLSEGWGLLPVSPPATALPPAYSAWDEVASRLPQLFRDVSARRALEALAVLDAADLPDGALLRAASVLGILAHTYVRVRSDVPARLPPAIEVPWSEVTHRLGRGDVALTYDDLVAYNWRLRDPLGPRSVENLRLLTPTVGTREEEVFYLAQVEMLAAGAPIIGTMAALQDAVLTGENAAELATGLTALIDALERATYAFAKVDPNPYSPTHVDPAVWAKTVAPFAVAIRPGGHAISGAAAPLFQALDVFIGRVEYKTRIGSESFRLRGGYSRNFRDYLEALGAVRVGDHIADRDDRELHGLWSTLLDRYGGERGFLGVHRRKAYAYLEVAFKVGRSVTTGGFTGLFEDQTWELAHRELELSRRERAVNERVACPVVPSESFMPGGLSTSTTVHVRVDTAGLGLHHRAGDRLALRVTNGPELVARTLQALRATGDEIVPINERWAAALRIWGRDSDLGALSLGELLELGRLRPVGRATAKTLHRATDSETLARIVNARAEGAWELWDMLDLVNEAGYDTTELWQAAGWEPHAISRLVPPAEPRLYSISIPPRPVPGQIELLVRPLHYEVEPSDVVPAASRHGMASNFLRRLAEGAASPTSVPLEVVAAPWFRLPGDPDRPIVMFAGGVGVAPFRYFLSAASRRRAAPAHLFVSTRSADDLERWRSELTPFVETGTLRIHGAVTGGPTRRTGDGGIAALLADNIAEITELTRGGAHLYVCGPAGFAAAVTGWLESAVGVENVRRLIGSRALHYDVFAAAGDAIAGDAVFDHSVIALHNDDAHGYWTVIDGDVYDIGEFAHRHAGGQAILHEVAGRDGTAAFHTVDHHANAEIVAMLGMYRVGSLRRIELGTLGRAVIGPTRLTYLPLHELFLRWVRMLHLAVEIENAVRHDFAILSTATTAGEDPGAMTWFKAELLLEAHARLLQEYVPALVETRLTELCELTVAACDERADVRHVCGLVTAVASGQPAMLAAATGAALRELLRSQDPTDTAAVADLLRGFSTLRSSIEEADLACLAAMKEALRRGVACFEQWERETMAHGNELLAVVNGIPATLAAFYDRASTYRLSTHSR